MSYWQLLDFISFILLVFVGWQILQSTLFWLFIWQLKEYRVDRLRAHFSLAVGKKQIFKFLNIFSFREWRLPRPSLRIILAFLLSVFLNYNLYFFFLRLSSFFVRKYPNFLFASFTFVLVLVFLLLPLTVGLINLVFSLMLRPIKELIIYLARIKVKSLKPLVIGITGSFAKTSTKLILGQVLSVKFNVLVTPKSVNTPLGVAKTIITKLKKTHDIFIVEMGAYRVGEIEKLCWLTGPKIGILTGIGDQHQALFGSFQKIKKAKYELIKSLPKNGLAVFNFKNSTARGLGKITKRVAVKFYGKEREKYKTKLLGKFQQVNIDCARVISLFLKIPLKDILEKVSQLEPRKGMFQKKEGIWGCMVLDDSFNANHQGFLVALDTLAKFASKKKILITPGIIELGKKSEKVHQSLAQKAGRIADLIILTDENFYQSFKKGLGGKNLDKLHLVREKADLNKVVKKHLDKKTVILLEGRVPRYIKNAVLL